MFIAYTLHAIKRLRKRRISEQLVEIVVKYGKRIRTGSETVYRLCVTKIKKLMAKGIAPHTMKPVVVVLSPKQVLITAYYEE